MEFHYSNLVYWSWIISVVCSRLLLKWKCAMELVTHSLKHSAWMYWLFWLHQYRNTTAALWLFGCPTEDNPIVNARQQQIYTQATHMCATTQKIISHVSRISRVVHIIQIISHVSHITCSSHHSSYFDSTDLLQSCSSQKCLNTIFPHHLHNTFSARQLSKQQIPGLHGSYHSTWLHPPIILSLLAQCTDSRLYTGLNLVNTNLLKQAAQCRSMHDFCKSSLRGVMYSNRWRIYFLRDWKVNMHVVIATLERQPQTRQCHALVAKQLVRLALPSKDNWDDSLCTVLHNPSPSCRSMGFVPNWIVLTLSAFK